MQITDVKIRKVDSGTLKAFVSVTFDNEFVVTGLKVVEGAKGLFVSMPSAKNANGEYKDTAFPLTKDFREVINFRIIAEYEDLVGTQASEQDTAQASEQDEFVAIGSEDELPF